MSDLHLEVGKAYGMFDIPVNAPYLLLAGDIGRLQDYDEYCSFLQQCCSKYEKVFLVLGNHEFYGVSREEGQGLLKQLSSEPVLKQKLVILDRNRYDINDRITILGCTLQPSLPQTPHKPHSYEGAAGQKELDWEQLQNPEHRKDVSWLKDQIKSIYHEGTNRMTIIVTHHAPSFSPSAKLDTGMSMWSNEFCSTLLLGEARDWEGLEHVGFWIFGHTHWNVHKRLGSFLDVVSNQRGHVHYGGNNKQRKLPSSRSSKDLQYSSHQSSRKPFWDRWKGDPKPPSNLLSFSTKQMDFPFNIQKVLDLSDAVTRLDKLLRSRSPQDGSQIVRLFWESR